LKEKKLIYSEFVVGIHPSHSAVPIWSVVKIEARLLFLKWKLKLGSDFLVRIFGENGL